jgi:3-deoxy-D-manno-octulosonic-acid transferase
MRLLYTLLLYLLTPLVLMRLLWRSRQLRAYRERIAERFGMVAQPAKPIAVWVHAVSVGEALAALPLIQRLLEQHGARSVWVTTTTPTGSERVRAALGERVHHSYAPYDLPDAVARFLDRVRPQQVVIMETELWPNLFRALARRGCPLSIANARLSPRSFRGYGRVSRFTRQVLSDVRWVAAQSALDAERFSALGARRVQNVGNLKFDIDPPAEQLAAGTALRRRLGAARPVWIAASTHDQEEAAALAAHQAIRQQLPDALLILVPRHPQRFDAVAALARESGVTSVRRSGIDLSGNAPIETDVLIGDSLGEMWLYLAAADLAFVGGSLVPVGGHNILEPAALGLPVLFGPRMHNFLAARELLLEAGAAREILEASDLPSAVLALLVDATTRQRMGESGKAAVLANRGALERLLQGLASDLHAVRPET